METQKKQVIEQWDALGKLGAGEAYTIMALYYILYYSHVDN